MSDNNKPQNNRYDNRPPRKVNDNDVRKHAKDLTREEVRELESMLRNDDGFKDEEIDQRGKKAGSPLASLGNSPAMYFHFEDQHPAIEDVMPLQFQRAGKIFWYFLSADKQANAGIETNDFVVAYSERGVELGKVLNKTEHIYKKVKKIDFIKNGFIRKATDADLKKRETLLARAEEAREHAKEINGHLGLHMKIIRVKYTVDDSKCIVYFTAQGRVDFREFIRQLASILHRRIEMRQIGVRDTTKMMGGLGPCGMPLCCSRFMHSFHPVSIKMAKDQGLSLNPSKLSGICGRLFCCLSYENDTYIELKKEFPQEDTRVYDPAEKREGIITKVSVIPKTIHLKFRQKLKDNSYKYEEMTIPLSRLEKQDDGTYKLLPGEDNLAIDLNDISVPIIPVELNDRPENKQDDRNKPRRKKRPQNRNNQQSNRTKTKDDNRNKPHNKNPKNSSENESDRKDKYKRKRKFTPSDNRRNESQPSRSSQGNQKKSDKPSS
ncbi:hypothetical protein KAH37_09215 [bacterium]|nr:hypothetical protein [bacterium]